ncbi:MAG: SH3 domain-containing protein [Deltaproteobacteria bacterium]|nr:SH3 domain-containing protein [Deltaproteobacteria bacterium]
MKISLKSLETSRKGLEKENRVLELRLLEKEAKIKELERKEASLRERLAETIQEVVRAKAKLRSLESRAEAASNIAETEIALKALKKQSRSEKQDPLISQAEQLLKMSYKEFEKENYGGALYLANQAKAHLKNIHLRPKEEPPEPLPGETPFSIPIPLEVLTTSNLRAGPSLDYDVVSTLRPGTRLLGYSRKGEWLYVKSESGLKGWIFQTLVKGR